MALFAPVDSANLNGDTGDKKRVAYFYDSDVGNYAYVAGHPMKPHRIRMAHSLVMNYAMYKKMEIYRAKPASKYEMTQFHTDEYVEFLQKVTPDNMDSYAKEQTKFNVGDDCPVFDGLFEFCAISAGGSMEGAARLNRGKADVAINWAGGLHHAKKSEASGFCYINDIVLGIIELLRFKQRVLYIDIDVHHGDGVEEAFYTTDRVMCVSFHKYGEYFPGTGELRDIGVGQGKHYSVNFPLRDGIDDAAYKGIFEPVIKSVMDWYRPEAVVLQCGGDSLSGDRLGCFNLSMEGHANCVNFVKSYNLPTLILGGGGYTMRNVARTWAFETGILVGQHMPSDLPYNDYYEYYAPDYELNVRASNMDNANSKDYLDKIRAQVIENLRRTTFAPSVQMTDVPRDSMAMNEEDEAEMEDLDEDQNPDKRNTQHRFDKYIEKPGELSDSEDEELNEANGVRKQPATRKRRNRLDYRNLTDWNGGSDMTSGAVTPQAASSGPENDADDDLNIDDAEPAEGSGRQTVSPPNVTNGDATALPEPSPKPATQEEEDVAMEDVGGDEAGTGTDEAATATAVSAPTAQGVTPPDSPPNAPGIATPDSSTDAVVPPAPALEPASAPAPAAVSSPSPQPPAQESTPPPPPPSEAQESAPEPAPASEPVIKDEMATEDATVTAQTEGLNEREEQNAEAEAATEQALNPT